MSDIRKKLNAIWDRVDDVTTSGDPVIIADMAFTAYDQDVNGLANAVEAVLKLHHARWTPNPIPGGYICDACGEPVESEPCSTVRAIEAELSEEEQGRAPQSSLHDATGTKTSRRSAEASHHAAL